MEFFEENCLTVLEWPPQSTDLIRLKIYGHFKSELKKQVIKNKKDLIEKVQLIWQKLTLCM